jgi:hypothetical protein
MFDVDQVREAGAAGRQPLASKQDRGEPEADIAPRVSILKEICGINSALR